MRRMTGVFLAVCLLVSGVVELPVHGVEVSAKACILMEAATGRVLYEKNAQEKLSMASTTKIMTTLLCIESGDLDEEFCVDNAAIHVEGSSMGLQENDIVTKRALCYGMLLPSGNDAANAAAVAVAGDIPAFIAMMNARAEQIGMTHTRFATPSGLEGAGHGSSAFDMALLTREAMRNSTFRDICSMPSASVNIRHPPYARTLYNTNKLLGMYEGVVGVKTGFTDEAGRCLVSACERDGVMLLCVTLNAPDDWQDHMRLYDFGFASVHCTELKSPENLTQRVVGGNAEQIPLAVQEQVTVGAWNDDVSAVNCKILKAPFIYAPVAAGDEVGTVEYYYEDTLIAAVPLCAAEDAAVQDVQVSENLFVKIWNRVKSLFS